MTEHAKAIKSVRLRIADSTQEIHQELHEDPLLSRLVHPDVTLTEYLTALGVFYNFYNCIEAARQQLDVWHSLSLAKECSALQLDLPSAEPDVASPGFSGEAEMLGGLYVALGASFGRSMFRKNISKAQPNAPKAFIGLRIESKTWLDVTAKLDTFGASAQNLQRIEAGAQKGFLFMKSLTSQRLESRPWLAPEKAVV